MSPASGGRSDIIKSLQHIDGASNASDLANVINDAFILPMMHFSPLSADLQPERDTQSPPVCCPAWLLRERRPSDKTYQIYSQLLLPRGQTTPMSVPKQKQVKDVHKDLRPISLTPILSKVAEELVIQEHIKAAILKKSHSQYFSCYAKVLTCQSQDGLSWASIGEQSRLTVSQHF